MQAPIEQLLLAAKSVLKNCYAPHSGFHVGSALITESGQIFSGCNIENGSYSMTLCAETSAIAQMVSQGGAQKIDHILVLSSAKIVTFPCGACLQRLFEFGHANTRLHLAHDDDHSTIDSRLLSEFLPYSFALLPEEERQV